MVTCMLWETIYERRERFVLAVPRTRLHTLEVTLIVSVLELYGRTHLIAFGGKGGSLCCCARVDSTLYWNQLSV